MNTYLSLVINPGSTSTKIAIFDKDKKIKEQTLRHDVNELKHFDTIYLQKDFRREIISSFLKENNYKLEDFSFFIGRGGLLKPLKNSGTYLINQEMINDLKDAKYGEHASNLGAIITYEYALATNKNAYIVDPVVVDELADIARVTGLKGIDKVSVFHALNQKAVAKSYAKEINKSYNDLSLIVCHLGGGISVGLHQNGRVVEVNNGLYGDGPFSPERTGALPLFQLLDYIDKFNLTTNEAKKMISGKGGLVSYLGTSNVSDIIKRANENDPEAKLYFEAMIYQVAKEIGALYIVAKTKVDAIILTGGICYNNQVVEMIKDYTNGIAKVVNYPGEEEMDALVNGVLRVINGEEKINTY